MICSDKIELNAGHSEIQRHEWTLLTVAERNYLIYNLLSVEALDFELLHIVLSFHTKVWHSKFSWAFELREPINVQLAAAYVTLIAQFFLLADESFVWAGPNLIGRKLYQNKVTTTKNSTETGARPVRALNRTHWILCVWRGLSNVKQLADCQNCVEIVQSIASGARQNEFDASFRCILSGAIVWLRHVTDMHASSEC